MTSREFRSVFWDDLATGLKEPAFPDSYAQASAEIAATDHVVRGSGSRLAAEVAP